MSVSSYNLYLYWINIRILLEYLLLKFFVFFDLLLIVNLVIVICFGDE